MSVKLAKGMGMNVKDFNLLKGLAALALVSAAASCASAFYLPGVAPRDYLPGEKVDLKVNKLTSTKTQCAAAIA